MNATKTPVQRDNEMLKAARWTWSNGRYTHPESSLPFVNRRVAISLARRGVRN